MAINRRAVHAIAAEPTLVSVKFTGCDQKGDPDARIAPVK